MINQIFDVWQFNLWLGLASLFAGLVAVSPCLLVPSLRRKILRADLDIESIGSVVLVAAIVAIGCYNYFSRTNGA